MPGRRLRVAITSIAATAIVAAASTSEAAIRTWPGSAPCNGSLSACIDGASSGDVIEIASNTVDQNINASPVNKSLLLRPAAGFHPVFAAGRDVFMAPSGNAGWSLRITGLTFAGVRVGISPSGVGSVALDHLQFTGLPPDPAIDFTPTGSTLAPTQITASIHDNHIIHDRGNGAGINIATSGEQVSGRIEVRDNLIETTVAASAGNRNYGFILFPSATGGTLEFDIVGNRVQPADWSVGDSSRVSLAFYLSASEGTSNGTFRLLNNTLVSARTGSQSVFGGLTLNDAGNNRYRLTNNTLIGGKPDGAWIRMLDASTGDFTNNLVYGASNIGINFLANTNSSFSNHHNAVFGAASNNFTPGAGTVSSDPLIGFAKPPRPAVASPLVNAGSSSAFSASGPGTLAAPIATDADGLRRILGSSIDIGAYEHGSSSLQHDTSGFAPTSVLTHPTLDGHADAMMQITRSDGRRNDALVLNPRPMTQSYSAINQRWSLLADDGFNLNGNAGFNLLNSVPGAEVGSMVVSGGLIFSTSGTSLPLPWPLLPSDWIFLVSATRGAGLSNVANPHPFGAAFINGQWRIINLDAAAMPVGAAFTIYAQPPSRNAYEHTVLPANQPAATVTLLDHPLLNSVPCAIAHVSASGNGFQAVPAFSVHYEPGLERWFIQSEAPPAALTPGTRFFVVVDPRSSEDACIGALFVDGFEG